MIRMTRREPNPKVAELKKLPLFAGLSSTVLRTLTSNLDEVTIPEGERFMAEGRSNDTFVILLDGEVHMIVGGRVHETLGRGDIIGLPSMFTRLDSTASVIAKSPVRALVASHKQFNSLVANPELEIRFKAAMFDRLRDEVYQLTHEQPQSAKANTAAKSKATGKKK